MKDLQAERLKYITAVVLYGTLGLLLRYVSLPSEVVALSRGILGFAFLFLYLKVRKRDIDRTALKENLKWLLISGVSLGMNWVFLFAAYLRTTVAIASLCNYMAPAIIVLISPVLLREPLNKRKLPCVAASLVGIFLISGLRKGDVGNASGIVMGLLAAACFVIIVICNRKMHDIDPFDKALVQLAVSAVTVLPYVLIRNHGTALQWDLKSVVLILIAGILHTGVAYCLYFSGIASLPVPTIAVLGYLEPVVSVLCSVFILHEHMSAAGWTGAALILGAAVISETIGESPGSGSGA